MKFNLREGVCFNERASFFDAATVVAYIVPHRGEMKLFWDQSNWKPLCKRCHDRKTLTEDIHPAYRY